MLEFAQKKRLLDVKRKHSTIVASITILATSKQWKTQGDSMIHQFQLHGYNIVLDVCSGAVHVVDEVAYDIIAIYENNSKEHVVNTVFAKHQSLGVTLDEVAECYDQVT